MILLCVCFFFPTKSHLSLIHGPNIPGSYAMLFFTAFDFMFTTRHIHNWASFRFGPATSFCLELLVIALNSYPVAYWTPSDLGGSSSSVISFCLFVLFLGFLRQTMEWFAISSSSGPHFVRTVHYVLSILGGPAWNSSWLHWVMQAPLPWQGCDPWREHKY